jgi:release factor glutamine methyltransferase
MSASSAAVMPEVRTVDAARRAWAEEFRIAGLESPQLDARLLTAHALGLDHAALAASGARRLNAAEETAIAALMRRRLAHEPVARIIGMKDFWSLSLHINDATLVPRPETETVVEAALAAIDHRGPRQRALRIADLGTGSGAILLALLTELDNAFGVGTDRDPRAIAAAHRNSRHLGVRRASFLACDLASALRGPFDLIVSNPPYIASRDIAALPLEVRLFDPRLALDGGADGLDFYRAIAAATPELLSVNGALVVEIGFNQADPVSRLFAAAGLAPWPPQPDLNGVPRALIATKRA